MDAGCGNDAYIDKQAAADEVAFVRELSAKLSKESQVILSTQGFADRRINSSWSTLWVIESYARCEPKCVSVVVIREMSKAPSGHARGLLGSSTQVHEAGEFSPFAIDRFSEVALNE